MFCESYAFRNLRETYLPCFGAKLPKLPYLDHLKITETRLAGWLAARGLGWAGPGWAFLGMAGMSLGLDLGMSNPCTPRKGLQQAQTK